MWIFRVPRYGLALTKQQLPQVFPVDVDAGQTAPPLVHRPLPAAFGVSQGRRNYPAGVSDQFSNSDGGDLAKSFFLWAMRIDGFRGINAHKPIFLPACMDSVAIHHVRVRQGELRRDPYCEQLSRLPTGRIYLLHDWKSL
jgi:hypothetical protein